MEMTGNQIIPPPRSRVDCVPQWDALPTPPSPNQPWQATTAICLPINNGGDFQNRSGHCYALVHRALVPCLVNEIDPLILALAGCPLKCKSSSAFYQQFPGCGL